MMPGWIQQLSPRQLQLYNLTPRELRQLGLHPRELRALGLRPLGQELIDLEQWPPEPPTPKIISPERLGSALRLLCPVLLPAERIERYARWIARYAEHFGVDPLLLAALIYQQSGCRAGKQNSWGAGLAMINLPMHRPRIRQGRYRYWTRGQRSWRARSLAMDRFAFTLENLRRAEPNIYFAAGLLKIFSAQCPAIDGGFRSVPHRHPVSHFIWGDKVKGAGVEDRILGVRRRLIEYYHGQPVIGLGRFEDLSLHCPLDGAPRKVTSGLGDDREGGKRRHTGIDLDSVRGEPVRAIADGKVLLAGVDHGSNNLRPLDPRLTRLVQTSRMGPRGLLVTVEHARGLTSLYMHLSAYVVRTGQTVKGGELLGYVGRSGMKDSDAHLHFGLQHHGKNIDPMPYLAPYVFEPEATYLGRNYLAQQQLRRQQRQRLGQSRRGSGHGRRQRQPGHTVRPWIGGTSRTPAKPTAKEDDAPSSNSPSLRPY